MAKTIRSNCYLVAVLWPKASSYWQGRGSEADEECRIGRERDASLRICRQPVARVMMLIPLDCMNKTLISRNIIMLLSKPDKSKLASDCRRTHAPNFPTDAPKGI